MDFKKQFDRPLPAINRDTKQIYIEASAGLSGVLTVKNDGGGLLSGRIMSNSSAVSFDPESFTGNDTAITFYVDVSMYGIGDTLKTEAVIMSNGGEHTVEFIVKIVPYAIETKEGVKISGMEEFYDYAKTTPVLARQLFVSHEFMMWLYASGYEYMDLYEKFVLDANKERALENFLTFNGFKGNCTLYIEQAAINIKLPPFSKEIYTGNIAVLKDDWGYVDEAVALISHAPWIHLEKERLATADFDETLTAYVSFFIDPAKLQAKRNLAMVQIGAEEVMITVIRSNYIDVRLEKNFLGQKADSFLLIENHSGSRLTVDVLPADSFIKFESTRYFVKENVKIPFQVELSTFQSAQVNLLKQPEIKTSIIVDTVFNKIPYVRKLELTVGGF